MKGAGEPIFEFDLPPPGALTTRHAAALQPTCRQIITIIQDTTTNPISYNVVKGALVFGFRLLFLRDPGPGDGDITLTVQDLEDFAERGFGQKTVARWADFWLPPPSG